MTQSTPQEPASRLPRPPEWVVDLARQVATWSPCRSKRGVVVFDPSDPGAIAHTTGHNGPPFPLTCPGRPICAGLCGQISVHAESRALHAIGTGSTKVRSRLDLVHVELTPGSDVVACDGPSCLSCSKEILESGLGGVWLYEAIPEEHCPHTLSTRTECAYCQNEACRICPPPGYPRESCEHDVIDRHGTMPTIDATWRYYTALAFHLATLARRGLSRTSTPGTGEADRRQQTDEGPREPWNANDATTPTTSPR
jgi:hypothetical protein